MGELSGWGSDVSVFSRQNFPRHLAIDIGESVIAPLVAPREGLVVEAEEMLSLIHI